MDCFSIEKMIIILLRLLIPLFPNTLFSYQEKGRDRSCVHKYLNKMEHHER